MNQGIRSYCKLLTQDIGNAGKGFVNVNPTNANLHLVIPIFTTPGLAPIALSLIYSHADQNETGDFGKGVKLNFFKQFALSSDKNTITMKNSDGSTDAFTWNNVNTNPRVYYCPKIHTTINATLTNDLSSIVELSVVDKQKNSWEFNGTRKYPTTIHLNDGTVYSFHYTSGVLDYIDNGHGTTAQFQLDSSSGYFENIKFPFLSDPNHYFICELFYSAASISSINYSKNELITPSLLYTNTYQLCTTPVYAIDGVSQYRVNYVVNGNSVSSFKDGTTTDLAGGSQVTLGYYGNYATATNYLGQTTYFYFDPNNLPLYDIDYKARAVAYKYDYNETTGTIELISQTNVVQNDPNATGNTNLVTNGYFNSSLTGWTANKSGVATIITDTSNLFHAILGSNTLQVVSTNNEDTTITQTISVAGIAKDNLSLYLWGRQTGDGSSSTNSFASATITLKQSGTEVFASIVYFTKYNLSVVGSAPWELLGTTISPEQSYDMVEVKIRVRSNSTYTFDAVQVKRVPMGSFYEYDDRGNILTNIVQEATSNASYTASDSIGTASNVADGTFSPTSTLFNYLYDEKGNLTEVQAAYGTQVKNQYNSNNQLLSTTLVWEASDDIQKPSILTSSTYTSAGLLATQTNDSGYTSSFVFNADTGQLDSTTDPTGTTTSPEYNVMGKASSIEVAKNGSSVSASYTYDARKSLNTVRAPNGDVYKYNYNTWNRIVSIAVGRAGQPTTNTFFTYEYQNQSTPTAVQTGNITKVTYGINGDSYTFTYNAINQITAVNYIVAGGTTPVAKYGFTYDDMGRILSSTTYLSDYASQTDFSYNPQGQLTEKNEEGEYVIGYRYDNLESVIQRKYDFAGNVSYVSMDPVYRSDGMNPQAVYATFQKSPSYLTGFLNRLAVDTQTHQTTDVRSADLITFVNTPFNKEPQFQISPLSGLNIATGTFNAIPCVLFNQISDRLAYQTNTNHDGQPRGTIAFWFNISGFSAGKCIFSTMADNGAYIAVYLDSYRRLVLKLRNDSGTIIENVIVSDTGFADGHWNFFSLSWINADGLGTDSTCLYEMRLNAEYKAFTKSDPRYFVANGEPATLFIGCFIDDEKTQVDRIDGSVTAILVSKDCHVSKEEVGQFYLATNEYIFANAFVNQQSGAVQAGATNVYSENPTFLSTYEIIPLNATLLGFSGKTPKYMTLRKTAEFDRDRTFNFNASIRRYAYMADGAELVYDFAAQNSGFIGMKVFVTGEGTKQYLFENVDANQRKIGLYRAADTSGNEHLLFIEINGTIIDTAIYLENNSWTPIGFTWSRTVISGSIETYTYQVRLVVYNDDDPQDPFVFEATLPFSTTLGSMLTSVGRARVGRQVSTGLVDTVTVYDPLYGQVEMLVYRNAFLAQATIESLWEDMKVKTVSNQYDVFGRLCYHSSGNSASSGPLYQTYAYAVNELDDTKTSTRVGSETFNFATTSQNFTHTYGYDGNGNAVSVAEGAASTTYQYDYRGYLTQENGPAAAFKYEYDSNGNITYKKNLDGTVVKHFTYATTGPSSDRLIQVGADQITYDSHSFGNPIRCATYAGETLLEEILYTWEGRNLIRWRDREDSVTLTDVKFAYDASGLRIKKTVGSVEHRYVYDSGNLVYEAYGSNTLRFLYDERGLLMSFILGTTHYEYVRDIMLNIIGLTDQAGNLVVRYTYDAWGNILSTSGTLASTVGAINPFRYKGYYYDRETGMYYCKSRYYNPQWCRWLNVDHQKDLDVSSPKGLNLFVYCGNNPVMYTDPSGEFSVSGFLLDVTASILGYIAACVMSIWDEQVWADMYSIGWNPFNTDESKVAGSKKVSFYKGQFVIRSDFSITNGRSFSFGIMFLDISVTNTPYGRDSVKHEWGHFVQLYYLGIPKFILFFGIPSMLTSGYDKYYYSYPWERSADLLGGVSGLYWGSSPYMPNSGFYSILYLLGIFVL